MNIILNSENCKWHDREMEKRFITKVKLLNRCKIDHSVQTFMCKIVFRQVGLNNPTLTKIYADKTNHLF